MTTQPLIVANLQIRRDSAGRYCLNDLHQAAGNEKRHQPANWLRLQQTNELIDALADSRTSIDVREGGLGQGTYVVKPLVYAYAMWISPTFHLAVINAYDELVTGGGSAMSDHSAAKHMARLSALSRLYRARSQAELEAVYEQAVQLSAALGLSPPEKPEPILGAHQAALLAFWTAIDALVAGGHRVNHARAEGVLALNLREVQALATQNGLVMPETGLPAALRACPRFVRANHAFNSPVAGKAVKCWVFKA